MPIDLRIPGDPTKLHTLADWLDTLHGNVLTMSGSLTTVAGDTRENYWSGEAAKSFHDLLYTINESVTLLSDFLREPPSVIRAYANRLARGQHTFDDWGKQAADLGLTVRKRVVASPSDGDAAKLKAYNKLAGYVGEWWGELEKWIAENLVPLTTSIGSFTALDKLAQRLGDNNPQMFAARSGYEYYNQRAADNLTTLRETASKMQADADVFSKGLRSGNPALRAAAEAANPKAVRQGLADLSVDIGKTAKLGSVLKAGGITTDIATTGIAMANGEGASSAAAGLLGGLGGAPVAEAGLTALIPLLPFDEIPPVLLASGVIVASSVTGQLAAWGWEAAAPIDVRETIDSYFAHPPRLAADDSIHEQQIRLGR